MEISINCHSSIRIACEKVIYFDPFKIEEESHDADIIFVTHDHFDHFSVEDIKKIEKNDTVYVIPECMYNLLGGENVVTMEPDSKALVEGFAVETIPSYNPNKPFHPKEKGYVAYIVTIEGKRVFVAGDCDVNEDNEKVKCDIALLPIGGKYTMDPAEAAGLANILHPQLVIPTHYGSITGSDDAAEQFKKLVDPDIEVKILV